MLKNIINFILGRLSINHEYFGKINLIKTPNANYWEANNGVSLGGIYVELFLETIEKKQPNKHHIAAFEKIKNINLNNTVLDALKLDENIKNWLPNKISEVSISLPYIDEISLFIWDNIVWRIDFEIEIDGLLCGVSAKARKDKIIELISSFN